MPPRVSNFSRSGQPDDRLAQSASTSLDASERQVMDQQVVDVQTILASILVNGVVGTYVTLDGAYTSATVGDVVCLSGSNSTTAVLATTSALAASGCVVGVLLETTPAGSRALVGQMGVLEKTTTGLASGSPGPVRVSALGRCERVASLLAGDFALGAVNAQGRLTLSPGSSFEGSAASVSFDDVKTALAAADDVVSFNGEKIVDLGDPTDPTDAANKQYVDAAYTAGDGLTLTAGEFAVDFGGTIDIENVAHGDTADPGNVDQPARIDHQHAVDSSSTGTANKLTAYGASGETTAAHFKTTGTVAGTGAFRVTSNSTPIAAKDSANADAALVAWSGADALTLGNTASATGVVLAVKTGGTVTAKIAGATKFSVNPTGVGVGASFDDGDGDNVVFLEDVFSAPSTNPSGGSVAYSDGGAVKVRSTGGALTTTASAADGGGSWEYGWDTASVQTTNATPALLFQSKVPDGSVGRIYYSVMSRTSDSANWYERVVRVQNDAGTVVIADTLTPGGIPDREDTDPGLDIAISAVAASNKINLNVTGVAATNLDWTASIRTEFFVPAP